MTTTTTRTVTIDTIQRDAEAAGYQRPWNRETGEMAEQMVESGIPTDGYCSILSDSAQRSGPWARRSRD